MIITDKRLIWFLYAVVAAYCEENLIEGVELSMEEIELAASISTGVEDEVTDEEIVKLCRELFEAFVKA